MKRLIFILLLSSLVWAQTRWTYKLPATGYAARLVGVGGTRTYGDTVSGSYNQYLNKHAFDVTKSGYYKLQVDAAGGTNFTDYTYLNGTNGFYIATGDTLGGSAIQGSRYAPDEATIRTKIVGSDTLIVADTSNTMATRSMVYNTARDSNTIEIAGKTVNIREHVEHKKILNLKDFSNVVGDGTTDDASAIQDAIDYVTAYNESPYSGMTRSKVRLYADGDYYITSTIHITCDVDMRNATFYVPTTFADTAIVVSAADNSSYLKLVDTYLPEVRVKSKVDPWTSGSVGIVFISLIDSDVRLNEVWYFETNVVITTWPSKGCSYNDFHLNTIRNGKTNLWIYPQSGGWTNENNFYGGRIRLDSGYSDTTGTVGLHLTGNNNAFYKLCVEGSSDETKIWLDGNSYGYGCAQNVFYSLRPESSYKWRILADGSETKRNTIFRGYISNFSDEINYDTANSATSEALSVMLAREDIKIGSDGNGIIKLQNLTSNSYPLLSFYALQTDPKVYPDSAVGQFNTTGFQFKRAYTYTDPYIKADGNAGSYGGLRFNLNGKDIDSAPYISGNWGGGTGYVELAIKNGSLILPDNAYGNNNYLILGSYFFWVDASGNLRINNGKPTSDTDGTVVGQQ